MSAPLQAPFPWPGGKSRAAGLIWERLGDVPNYVEPFAGSLAVMLSRPHEPKTETVNDLDGMIVNAWRALRADPEQTAHWADWPVSEADLTARHLWLVAQREDLVLRLQGDPDFFDPKIAGWWLWGISCWIGSGFCSGEGPWRSIDGKLVDSRQLPHLSGEQGVKRKIPHLYRPRDVIRAQGAKRQMPYLNTGGLGVHQNGVKRKRPQLGRGGHGVVSDEAVGVSRQVPNIGNNGKGLFSPSAPSGLLKWFETLSGRLRKVRICCGDWSRVLGPSPTFLIGLTGVLLDPPYAGYEDLYRAESVSARVREWAIANGDNPLLRIALCGYDDEHAMPEGWERVTWTATGGYGNQRKNGTNDNRHREVIWFSPACLNPAESLPLFAAIAEAGNV